MNLVLLFFVRPLQSSCGFRAQACERATKPVMAANQRQPWKPWKHWRDDDKDGDDPDAKRARPSRSYTPDTKCFGCGRLVEFQKSTGWIKIHDKEPDGVCLVRRMNEAQKERLVPHGNKWHFIVCWPCVGKILRDDHPELSGHCHDRITKFMSFLARSGRLARVAPEAADST